MLDLDFAFHALDSLSGLIPNEQGRMLSDYAAAVPSDQAIVEIGSYRGKSTCYLAYGAGPKGAKVYAIDPWDTAGNVDGTHGFANPETFARFNANVRTMGYQDRIIPIKDFSTLVACRWHDLPVGLLYIDGDHKEESVRADYESWFPHLAPHATVIFDDLDTPRNPGVRIVVDQIPKSVFKFLMIIGRCAVFTR